ncbi:MAG: phosphohistidine phosphatase [Cyclobacteriaceae bacterium]|jgi:phosphohistidine phosphatase
MVRKIFLLRHGEAAIPEHGVTDFNRHLTPKGFNQIRSLGAKLTEISYKPSIVYCSTSERTRQTCQNLTESMNQTWDVEFLEEIYEGSVRSLFEVLSQTERDLHQILLIGHNPGISFLAEYLTGENVGNMMPGQLLKLEFALGDWSELSQQTCSLIN